MKKKLLIIAVAAFSFTAIVCGLWKILTSDALFDVELEFDVNESFLSDLEKRGLGEASLCSYAENIFLMSGSGMIVVLDDEDRVLTCHRNHLTKFVGKPMSELVCDVAPGGYHWQGTRLLLGTDGSRYFARTHRCCGHDVVMVILHEYAMWSRNRAVPIVAAALLLVLCGFVGLIFRQIRLSERLNVYIEAEERAIASERSAGAEIQLSALPRKFPAFPSLSEFDLYADMKSAKDVGGDFYDFFRLGDGRIAFLVADVTGKGLPAALFMMNAKATLKSLLNLGLPLSMVATRANHILREGNGRHMLVSAWIGLLDVETGEVEFVNAGHNPPVRFGGAGAAYFREANGPMLAAMRRVDYTSGRFRLAPGERLLLYTDGVTEAHDTTDRLFGEERLLALSETLAGKTATEICDEVKNAVDAFSQGREQFDDITVLAVEYRGALPAQVKTFPTDRTGLAAALVFVEESLKDQSADLSTKMSITADELFSNIVKYSGAHDFTVSIDKTERQVRMTCRDNGHQWNPLADSVFDPSVDPKRRKFGGMGLHIVRRMMDDILYARREGMNELKVVKRNDKGQSLLI